MTWRKVKLSEIFDIARGGSPRPIDSYLTDAPDAVNWISIKDASESGKYIRSTKLKIKPEGASKSRFVKPGDFLLTNSMSFGRPYIMQTTGCIHDGWLVLSDKSGSVDPDFLYYLLGSPQMYQEFAKRAAGAVVKNLNIDLVKGVSIPLPPLEVQKKIAAVLEKADELRRKREEQIKRLDDLLQATFLDMFGDPVTNPKGWPVLKLEEVGEITTGNTPPTKEKNMFDGEIPFVTPGDLKESWVSTIRTVTKDGAQKSRTVMKGATLVCCIGATIGKMGKAAEYSAFNQQINAISWGSSVEHNFGLEIMKLFKQKIALAGASTTLPILNKGLFKKIAIPVPPVTLQNAFARIVHSIEGQKEIFLEQLKANNTLFTSLMQRAFKGELDLI